MQLDPNIKFSFKEKALSVKRNVRNDIYISNYNSINCSEIDTNIRAIQSLHDYIYQTGFYTNQRMTHVLLNNIYKYYLSDDVDENLKLIALHLISFLTVNMHSSNKNFKYEVECPNIEFLKHVNPDNLSYFIEQLMNGSNIQKDTSLLFISFILRKFDGENNLDDNVRGALVDFVCKTDFIIDGMVMRVPELIDTLIEKKYMSKQDLFQNPNDMLQKIDMYLRSGVYDQRTFAQCVSYLSYYYRKNKNAPSEHIIELISFFKGMKKLNAESGVSTILTSLVKILKHMKISPELRSQTHEMLLSTVNEHPGTGKAILEYFSAHIGELQMDRNIVFEVFLGSIMKNTVKNQIPMLFILVKEFLTSQNFFNENLLNLFFNFIESSNEEELRVGVEGIQAVYNMARDSQSSLDLLRDALTQYSSTIEDLMQSSNESVYTTASSLLNLIF